MDTTLAGQPAGQLLDGRYRLASAIARGGMAAIYRATDTRLDRLVAVKIMHPELAADQEFVARFIREARSVARLSHPNVVAVFDQGADGGHLYLVMEYVQGRTLRQLLADHGRLSPRDALDIIESVLCGLDAAHRAGIVHRDVKPENVLIATDGRVRVADFGLARSMTGTSHTKTGILMGTVAYLAPEQVATGISDTRSDVYAAGVMLFELLTGCQPHTGESALAVAFKHVNEPVPAPSAVAPGLPDSLDALVARATSRDPALRPADAGEFLRAVRAVRGGQPIPPAAALEAAPASGEPAEQTLTVPLGAALAPPREPALARWLFSRRLVYLGAALVAAVLAGTLAWWQLAGRYTTVPQVSRLSVATAANRLRAMGFTVRTGAPRVDNKVASGKVITTVPAAGSRVGRHSSVELIPSKGPRLISVPQVSGEPLASALTALRRAGLTPGRVIKQASATAAAGTVIGTRPPAGSSWPQPQPVIISVSTGPPLPDFTGVQLSAVRQWAASNGVSLDVRQDSASSQPRGTITRQSPGAGTGFTRGETVTVYVSPGPPEVTVPNVDGDGVRQASRILQALGFSVRTVRAGPFGRRVFAYTPSGQAPKGTTITLWWGLPSLGI